MPNTPKPQESTEPKAFDIHFVSMAERTVCDRCSQQTQTGGACEECEMELRENL